MCPFFELKFCQINNFPEGAFAEMVLHTSSHSLLDLTLSYQGMYVNL